MSCSPFDLKDYFLKELPEPDSRQVEAHVKSCQPCREELDRLSLTEAALFSLRDEEIPQRIAFVSDKIFEPSPLRKWWNSRFGFAAATVALTLAVVVATLQTRRPDPSPLAFQNVSAQEIQARIDAAVSKAVAEVEARHSAKAQAILAELEAGRQQLLIAAAELELSQKRSNSLRASAYSMPPAGGR
jgi:anti-sigma factor RsiW